MIIQKISQDNIEELFAMMRDFYDSPALIHRSSDRVLRQSIEACLSDNPYIDGYVFLQDGDIIGYTMIAKSYTTEYGGLCVWIEDLYFKPAYRGKGYGTEFFQQVEGLYPDAVRFKLEVEQENIAAVAAYKKNGYAVSGYHLMTKEIDKDE
ncbi:MAG: GNAT family N-acetyltransferase [Wujia sp.]